MAHKDNTKNEENAVKAAAAGDVAVEETVAAFVAPVKSVNTVGNHTMVVQLSPKPTSV